MDRDEFVERIDRRSDMLYRIARTILRSDADCQDALQDAVLNAWEHRARLRDEAAFEPWITRILINSCHSIHRRHHRYGPVAEVEPTPVQPPDPELRMALETSPENVRLPMVLHYLEGELPRHGTCAAPAGEHGARQAKRWPQGAAYALSGSAVFRNLVGMDTPGSGLEAISQQPRGEAASDGITLSISGFVYDGERLALAFQAYNEQPENAAFTRLVSLKINGEEVSFAPKSR